MNTLLDHITESLLLIFLIITFLQSGIDKLTDWSGNVSWLKEHFSKTFLRGVVPAMVASILLIEVIAALLCIVGLYQINTSGETTLATYGAALSAITLLMLLFGQRVAKDYDGARTIVIYFIPTVFLLFLLK